MDEQLLKKLKKKDNYSDNQYYRIKKLANYMSKRAFDKDYKKNVIKLITYYNYIKNIDTKGYCKDYVVPFSSYINKYYDETKTKEYFDGNISEDEFLDEFINSKEVEELDKEQEMFMITRRPLKLHLKDSKIKKGITNIYINIKFLVEKINRKNPYINKRMELRDWHNEYFQNLKEAQKNNNSFSMNENKEKIKK